MKWKQLCTVFLVLGALAPNAYGEDPNYVELKQHKNGVIVAGGRVIRIQREANVVVQGIAVPVVAAMPMPVAVPMPPPPPVDYYADIEFGIQMAAVSANNGIPSQSGTLPSGATFDLQINGTQFEYDFRGPVGGTFHISGDLATGHGSVRGTLPSGSSLAWAW